MGKTNWRPEPQSVEKGPDDVWLGVKFQPNTDIAGSPRNSFRASLVKEITGGRALNAQWPHLEVLSVIKLRMPVKEDGSQTLGDKVQCRKGNSPDRQLRSQNKR